MWRVILAVVAALAFPVQAVAALEPEYVQSHVPLTGSCGNVWASATIHRSYESLGSRGGPKRRDVWLLNYSGGDGAGGFTTRAGSSPGACATYMPRGTSVGAGVHGRLRGVDRLWMFGRGGFDPTGACAAPCTPEQFVAAFYPPGTDWTLFSSWVQYLVRPASKWYPGLCLATFNVSGDPSGVAYGGDIASTC
jgi:hypothetical protein